MTDNDFPTDEEPAAGQFEIGYLCLFCGEEVATNAADSAS